MGEQARKESNWTPPEDRSPGLDRYGQAIRECVNTRFIRRTHKVVQNITQAQRNAILALKTNCNFFIKPADKGGAIVMHNRTDYYKEVYQQLNNLLAPVSVTILQKLSIHRPGTFLVMMDVLAVHTSIPHDDDITATASVLTTTNCQFPDAILQLTCFILDHNAFTFDNQLFIQTHGTVMRIRFAPQYANIFMHRFKQDFFPTQNLRPTLFTRYIDDSFFLWTH
eukprot:g35181.t1